MPTTNDLLRQLPQVDELVRAARAAPANGALPRPLLARAAREVLAEVRRGILEGRLARVPSRRDFDTRVTDRALALEQPNQCRVINATGVVLHTNLGRAVLPAAVLAEVSERLRGYSLLEVDRATGRRSKRDLLVVDLLRELTGAEDATVVNNNAAATHIILNTLAEGREVVCSHAHLVGIGGSFRMPDCMERAGVTLRTVGATNHCPIADYASGINERTALLLVVHTSNYRIVGFTRYATLEEVVALGKERGLPVVYDLGSGALVDVSACGYEGHGVKELVAAGPDLVCFSGDKLLGGPQAGVIVGRREALAAIRQNPFYRMMRPDKVTLALLESTLRLYLDPERAADQVPVLRMIRASADGLRRRARRFAARLKKAGLPVAVEVVDAVSEIGGGSLSGQPLPTACVGLRPSGLSLEALAARLRTGEPCVFARLSDDRLLLDLRTSLDGEEGELLAAVQRALAD